MSMTLEEAIIHAEEVVDWCEVTDGDRACAAEHRQLAEWLKELAERRKLPEIIRCKNCKHNVSSHKCLHPESFFLVPDDDFYCGYAERRSDE